uniref:AlNc14C254G9705 protein n=1 Tax=Albugo laibachii Nc14 TaxID=890382 RepID=F0WTM8_9STRA|nr:AlNc14C254G9705 [Albugo laibachii Nc14]|eukprot:CCA24720.1 AlNc14C254G9705 [Albugo laibachii Nc14]
MKEALSALSRTNDILADWYQQAFNYDTQEFLAYWSKSLALNKLMGRVLKGKAHYRWTWIGRQTNDPERVQYIM